MQSGRGGKHQLPRNPGTPQAPAPASPSSSAVAGGGISLGVLLLAGWAVLSMTSREVRHSQNGNLFVWPADVTVYYQAVQHLFREHSLYDATYVFDLPFTYPPFAAVVFSPMILMERKPLIVIWQLGSLVILFAVIAATLRQRGYKWPSLFIISIAGVFASFNLAAVHGTFFWGQINIYLMGLVALDFLRGSKGRLRGLGTGLAAGIKLTPALSAIVFVLERRWKPLFVAIGTFVVSVIAGCLLIPDGLRYWTRYMFETSRIGVQSNPGAHSLRGALYRWHNTDQIALWLILDVLVIIVFLIAVRGAIKHEDLPMAMCLSGITAPIIAPFSWYHHWVFLVPTGIVLICDISKGFALATQRIHNNRVRWFVNQCGGFLSVAIVSVAFVPFVNPYSVPAFRNLAYSESFDPTIIPGSYVGTGIAILIVVALRYTIESAVTSSTHAPQPSHTRQTAHTPRHSAQRRAPQKWGSPARSSSRNHL